MVERNTANPTEEQKAKAVGQFRMQLTGIFEPFMCYGLQDIVPEAKELTIELALLLHKNLNGLEVPIDYELARRKHIIRRVKGK